METEVCGVRGCLAYQTSNVYLAAAMYETEGGILAEDVNGVPVLARCCLCSNVILATDGHGNFASMKDWLHWPECPDCTWTSNLSDQKIRFD